MIKENLQLVQFDWSGTLSDDRLPIHYTNQEINKHFGLPTEDSFEEWMRNSKGNLHDSLKSLNVELTPEEVNSLFMKHFVAALESGVRPFMYDDVPEVLQHLTERGIKLAVLSSHPQKNVMKEAEQYGIAQYFDVVIGGVREKSEGMKEIARDLGVELGNIVYVGDMASDIISAKKANIIPIAVTRGYHTAATLSLQEPYVIWDDLRPALEDF